MVASSLAACLATLATCLVATSASCLVAASASFQVAASASYQVVASYRAAASWVVPSLVNPSLADPSLAVASSEWWSSLSVAAMVDPSFAVPVEGRSLELLAQAYQELQLSRFHAIVPNRPH